MALYFRMEAREHPRWQGRAPTASEFDRWFDQVALVIDPLYEYQLQAAKRGVKFFFWAQLGM